MIVRILGEQQLQVPDAALEELDRLDESLTAAIEAEDEQAFAPALTTLVERIRSLGTPLPDEALSPSALILPAADSSLSDVRAMLTDEGLIHG